MSRTRVFRIQDIEGRGPYRPGMSQHWVDDHGPPPPPTWMEEFGDVTNTLLPDEHVGCGCISLDQLFRWFTPTELQRLGQLRYRLVTIWADRILAQSVNQVVFTSKKPLALATVLRLPEANKPQTLTESESATEKTNMRILT